MKRWLLCIALTVAACSKSATPGGVRIKQVTSALASAGFKVDALATMDPSKLAAQQCVAGALEGVETLLCEYGSVDAVALGRKAASEWIADATTGAVAANGNTVIALADRKRADPNGKMIHKLTQTFAAIH